MDSYIPVCLSAIAGVVLSVLAGTIVWQSESDRIEEQFPERADSLVLALQNSLDESLQVTRATGTLLEAAPALPREGFEQFSRTFVTRYPGLVELGWATIAPETNNISHLYRVSENASDDRPRQTDGDRRAIAKAIRSSIAVATPPVPITSDGDWAFTVYHPVYGSTERESLRGVVYGVYRVQYWLKTSLGALNLESLDFYLYGMPLDQLDSSLKKGTIGAQENFLVFYDSQQRLLITDREQLPTTAIGMDDRSYPNYCPFDRQGTIVNYRSRTTAYYCNWHGRSFLPKLLSLRSPGNDLHSYPQCRRSRMVVACFTAIFSGEPCLASRKHYHYWTAVYRFTGQFFAIVRAPPPSHRSPQPPPQRRTTSVATVTTNVAANRVGTQAN